MATDKRSEFNWENREVHQGTTKTQLDQEDRYNITGRDRVRPRPARTTPDLQKPAGPACHKGSNYHKPRRIPGGALWVGHGRDGNSSTNIAMLKLPSIPYPASSVVDNVTSPPPTRAPDTMDPDQPPPASQSFLVRGWTSFLGNRRERPLDPAIKSSPVHPARPLFTGGRTWGPKSTLD